MELAESSHPNRSSARYAISLLCSVHGTLSETNGGGRGEMLSPFVSTISRILSCSQANNSREPNKIFITLVLFKKSNKIKKTRPCSNDSR